MNLPYFAFYVRDYLGSTTVSRLTLEEQGALVRFLAVAWDADGLPADHGELALLLGLPAGSQRAERVINRVVALCWKPDPDDPRLLRNDRQETERAKAGAKWQKKVEALALGRSRNPKNTTRRKNKPQIKDQIPNEITPAITNEIPDEITSGRKNQTLLLKEERAREAPGPPVPPAPRRAGNLERPDLSGILPGTPWYQRKAELEGGG